MKEIDIIGIIGIAIIFLNSIHFFASKFNLFNVLSFLIITIGSGYIASRLQEEIRKNINLNPSNAQKTEETTKEIK